MRILSSVQIEYLRREAKTLARAQGIILAKALDQKANTVGFNNWALLINSHSGSSSPQTYYPTFLRTADEMKKSFRKISDLTTPTTDEKIRSALPDLSREYQGPMNALQYAERYIETALSLPRYSPSRSSVGYVEMRVYLPYNLQPLREESDVFILLGRDYKPLGMPQKHERIEYEKYENLHVRIPKNELERITRNPGYSPSYLYGDGSIPQKDRKHAESYLKQLKSIMSLVAEYT